MFLIFPLLCLLLGARAANNTCESNKPKLLPGISEDLTPCYADHTHCPRGLGGLKCDQPAWPSCTVGGIVGDCRTPNTCACAAQCDEHEFLHREFRVCYDSDNPLNVDDLVSAPVIKYRSKHGLPYGMPDCGLRCDEGAQNQRVEPELRDKLVPLHLCPNRCSGRGFCFAGNGAHCRCFWNDGASSSSDAASGEDCSGSVPLKPCPNACSNSGTCMNGVCTCVAGLSGADCSLPFDRTRRVALKRPLVFVYDLPPAFNAWQDLVAVDRNVGWHLWQAFLNSEHRTDDARAADYFFIPVWPMGTFGLDVAAAAFQHIIQKEPHWNRTQGSNHLVAFPYDFAACQIMRLPYFKRIRVIGHYGLTEGGPRICIDPPYGGPAYRAGLDLLVPDTMELDFKKQSPYLSTADPETVWQGRSVTLFFAGLRSGPLRSKLFDLHLSEEGFRIVEGHVDLAVEMRAAVFCLDAGAAGFSTRFTLAIVMGCVPVWLDEGVVPSWSDTLPIETFSVRVNAHDLIVPGGLKRALDAASEPENLNALRRAGAAVWRKYVWKFMGIDVGDNEDALATLFERLKKFAPEIDE